MHKNAGLQIRMATLSHGNMEVWVSYRIKCMGGRKGGGDSCGQFSSLLTIKKLCEGGIMKIPCISPKKKGRILLHLNVMIYDLDVIAENS